MSIDLIRWTNKNRAGLTRYRWRKCYARIVGSSSIERNRNSLVVWNYCRLADIDGTLTFVAIRLGVLDRDSCMMACSLSLCNCGIGDVGGLVTKDGSVTRVAGGMLGRGDSNLVASGYIEDHVVVAVNSRDILVVVVFLNVVTLAIVCALTLLFAMTLMLSIVATELVFFDFVAMNLASMASLFSIGFLILVISMDIVILLLARATVGVISSVGMSRGLGKPSVTLGNTIAKVVISCNCHFDSDIISKGFGHQKGV